MKKEIMNALYEYVQAVKTQDCNCIDLKINFKIPIDYLGTEHFMEVVDEAELIYQSFMKKKTDNPVVSDESLEAMIVLFAASVSITNVIKSDVENKINDMHYEDNVLAFPNVK